jgi:hypothetical protein
MIGMQVNRRFIECANHYLELVHDRRMIAGTLH